MKMGKNIFLFFKVIKKQKYSALKQKSWKFGMEKLRKTVAKSRIKYEKKKKRFVLVC